MMTKVEKILIIILVCALVAGVGVSIYKKSAHRPQVSIRHGYPDRGHPEALIPVRQVNINTASLEELMKLKGVGSVLAGRILEYRASIGQFGSIEELQNVKGISKRIILKNKDSIILKDQP